MTAYLVAPTGNDGTGDGSFSAPFLTIKKAAAVAAVTPVDAIEVEAGETLETVGFSSPFGFHTLRGRGATKTVVNINVATWLTVDSADAPRLLIEDMEIVAIDGEAVLLDVTASDDTAGAITFARCGITLLEPEDELLRYAGPDPQTFVPALTVDFFHCVIRGPEDDFEASAIHAIRGTGSPSHVIAARNCIFTRLSAVNAPDSQPFDSDYNCYFGNYRDLTLGAYGDNDLRETDPELVGGTLLLDAGSDLRARGVDLRAGYGWPRRLPPEELNLAFPGVAPTIGLGELSILGARTTTVATNIHVLILALSGEAENARVDLEAVRASRSLRTASGPELSRRWGSLTGLLYLGDDVEDYRADLTDLLASTLNFAPTWYAIRRLGELLYGRNSRLIRSDYNKRYQFQVGNDLKLWADASGGLPTFDYYLTKGEVLLEGRWLQVRQTAFTADVEDAVQTVYIDGADPLDADENAKILSSSEDISDETRALLACNLTFRRGETKVIATGADLPATVQANRRITHGFSATDFVVESVDGARELTLRYPFPEEDHTGKGWVITPNHVFGSVTLTAAGGITAIDSPGRAGLTTRPVSEETRAHAYDLTLDAAGTALAGADARVQLLFDMLGRVHPVHKLMFFRVAD